MKLFQSKKSRRLLLLIGLPLLALIGYASYEIYTMQQAMQELGEGLHKLMSAFNRVQPDTTTVIDSTQVVTDSITVR